MIKFLTNFYYSYLLGEYPENKEDYDKTYKTISYLIEAGINVDTIKKNVFENIPFKERLSYEDLPNNLWDNSLLEKDKFYYHIQLLIANTAPGWDDEEDFHPYIEPKIKYSLDDALDYFIERAGVRSDWINRAKEIGSIKFLLKDFEKFNFIEPIDFFLHLVDFAVSKDEINTVYDLREYEIELAEFLENDIANAIAQKKNTYIWR